MSAELGDRRIANTQYDSVCKPDFDKLKKGQKKQKKATKELTRIVKNGHSASIANLLKQNRWILGMIGTTFFVLLAGMVAVILRGS